MEIVVTDSPEAAAAEVARLLAAVAVSGGSVALAGGSSPRAAYLRATELEADWAAVDAWLGDERCVPPEDERANARLVRETLVAGATDPLVLHPVDTLLPPADAASLYHAGLIGVGFDLVLLGLGPDGHTASLFPHAPSLDEDERLAIPAEAGLEPWVDRVTMTIPALSAARQVVFLAVGEDKAAAARRAFGEPPSRATPASLIRSTTGTTIAILDEAAAAGLRPS